jgi:hypothetical protein
MKGGAVAGHELETVADETKPASVDTAPAPTDIVRVALAFKKAVDELVRLAHASRSLGLVSWSTGVVFAGTAVGLRFVRAKDMAAPEFVSCIVFASLLVLFGIAVYILESRGYVKLVSQIAVKQLDGGDEQRVRDGNGEAG